MFLQIQGIKKSFGAGDSRVDVLKGLDLDIERGEFCVLLGPSGSGKSTLLNIIGGIDSADEGNLAIDGELSLIHISAAGSERLFICVTRLSDR